MIKQILICDNDIKRKINVDSNLSNVVELKNLIIKNLEKDVCNTKFFLKDLDTGILINNKNLNKLINSNKTLCVDIIYRLKGGIVDAIFNMLKGIITMFLSMFKILKVFFEFFVTVIELIPLIFDPPRLIDDVLFGVTFGINQMFRAMSDSAGGLTSTPEDDEAGGGATFDLDKETPKKCMSPTFTTILMLIICPPLAIFIKLGFWKGFVSAIICGVLCVKLFYFPGLLFAILHVLC